MRVHPIYKVAALAATIGCGVMMEDKWAIGFMVGLLVFLVMNSPQIPEASSTEFVQSAQTRRGPPLPH